MKTTTKISLSCEARSNAKVAELCSAFHKFETLLTDALNEVERIDGELMEIAEDEIVMLEKHNKNYALEVIYGDVITVTQSNCELAYEIENLIERLRLNFSIYKDAECFQKLKSSI